MKEFDFVCPNLADTQNLAASLGRVVKGGDVLEFKSDLGGGKTAFVKGLAVGMGITDIVQSPSFTISFVHQARRGLQLHHFDFYRLTSAGIMANELAESINQPNAVVAVEWGDIVHNVLPKNRVTITLKMGPGETRHIKFAVPEASRHIIKALKGYK